MEEKKSGGMEGSAAGVAAVNLFRAGPRRRIHQGSQIWQILMKFDEMWWNRSGLNSKISEFWNLNLI
jgi:hypothetical protein